MGLVGSIGSTMDVKLFFDRFVGFRRISLMDPSLQLLEIGLTIPARLTRKLRMKYSEVSLYPCLTMTATRIILKFVRSIMFWNVQKPRPVDEELHDHVALTFVHAAHDLEPQPKRTRLTVPDQKKDHLE